MLSHYTAGRNAPVQKLPDVQAPCEHVQLSLPLYNVNTYAVQPLNPFVPVFHVKAFNASEALEKALTIHPVHGIWPVS